MGHYDSCYAAEERIADERSVKYLESRFPVLTFDQKLAMKRAMDEFCRLVDSDKLIGSKEDHRAFKRIYEAFRSVT